MKKLIPALAALMFFAFVGTGCSTMGHIRIPAGTTLKVSDREASLDKETGTWKTSPFFWNTAGGAPYQLLDSSGKVIRTGKLKTHFRVASIFWPPGAVIYWPMGFQKGEFDLTKPADGILVRDEVAMASSGAPAATEAAPAATTEAPKAKAKGKKH